MSEWFHSLPGWVVLPVFVAAGFLAAAGLDQYERYLMKNILIGETEAFLKRVAA